MKRKMKSILGCLLTLCMIGALFAGCQNKSKETNDPNAGEGNKKITLTFMTLTSRQEATVAATKEFMEKNKDIEIKVTYNQVDDHKTNLMIMASSKTLPDMWRNWGGSLGSYYPKNGLSYDLTQYAKDNKWEDKFLPAALDLAKVDGKISGRPFVINAMGMFYRKDLFEKYGIKVPSTFEELEGAMATLKQNNITPISTAGLNGWHVMRLLEAMIEMYAGPDVHDKLLTLEEDWSQPSVVQAFTKFKEWIDEGYFPEGFLTADPNETKLLLYADQAAMDIQGPWYESNIIADGQDLDKYGFFKMPLRNGADRMSAFIEMIQFNADIDDEKLEAAMKYLDFIFSPEIVAKYGMQTPLPYKVDGYSKNQVLVPQVVDAMNKYGTFTIADQGLPQEVVSKLFQAQDSIATGKMTPEEAAKFMQAEAERYKSANK
jgi:raffinose/stachyose/melibiose transport system substrate-binding protein